MVHSIDASVAVLGEVQALTDFFGSAYRDLRHRCGTEFIAQVGRTTFSEAAPLGIYDRHAQAIKNAQWSDV